MRVVFGKDFLSTGRPAQLRGFREHLNAVSEINKRGAAIHGLKSLHASAVDPYAAMGIAIECADPRWGEQTRGATDFREERHPA